MLSLNSINEFYKSSKNITFVWSFGHQTIIIERPLYIFFDWNILLLWKIGDISFYFVSFCFGGLSEFDELILEVIKEYPLCVKF